MQFGINLLKPVTLTWKVWCVLCSPMKKWKFLVCICWIPRSLNLIPLDFIFVLKCYEFAPCHLLLWYWGVTSASPLHQGCLLICQFTLPTSFCTTHILLLQIPAFNSQLKSHQIPPLLPPCPHYTNKDHHPIPFISRREIENCPYIFSNYSLLTMPHREDHKKGKLIPMEYSFQPQEIYIWILN